MLMQPVRGKSPDPAGKGAESTVALRKKNQSSADKPVSLKILADYLGLCPATVSVVLNNVPGRSIPAETREAGGRGGRKIQLPTKPARPLATKTGDVHRWRTRPRIEGWVSPPGHERNCRPPHARGLFLFQRAAPPQSRHDRGVPAPAG